MDKKIKSRIVAALRKIWLWSEERKLALDNAKVGKNQYKCNDCQNIFSKKQVNVDHQYPIGHWNSLDDFAEKLFCDNSLLQILCIDCHQFKSRKERELDGK
jgi:hypothetical protein